MKKHSKFFKLLPVAAVAAAWGFSAPAAAQVTHYISRCDSGTLSGQCFGGNTINDGLTPATAKTSVADWFALYNGGIACGDTVLFARGGAWTGFGNGGARLQHAECTEATRITIGAYTPTAITYPTPISGNATAQTNTTVTDSSASFPTASGGLTGYGIELTDWVGAMSYHLIASNTATAITLVAGEQVPYTFDPTVDVAPYRVVPPRPILQETTNNAFNFTQSGGSPGTPNGFVTFQDLHLIGAPGQGQYGFFWNRSFHNAILQRLRIEQFAIGILGGDSAANGVTTEPRTAGFQILKTYIYNNNSQGVLYGSDSTLFENVMFDKNASGKTDHEHNVYTGASNLTIRRSTFLRNVTTAGVCSGSSFVMHGKHDAFRFVGNFQYETPAAQGGGCYGVDLSGQYDPPYGMERFRNAVIDGNTLVNMGGVGIGCSACVAPVIQNNMIAYEQAGPSGNWAIMVPNANFEATDAPTTGAKIRYNTVWMGGNNSDSMGISLGFIPGYASPSNNNMELVGNGIFFSAAGNATRYCYDLAALTLTNFNVFDYNGCYLNGAGRWSRTGNTASYANLAAAQAAGYDTHGLNTLPSFTTPSKATKWKLTYGAPWTNAASPTNTIPYDIDGHVRPVPSTMGAKQ